MKIKLVSRGQWFDDISNKHGFVFPDLFHYYTEGIPVTQVNDSVYMIQRSSKDTLRMVNFFAPLLGSKLKDNPNSFHQLISFIISNGIQVNLEALEKYGYKVEIIND